MRAINVLLSILISLLLALGVFNAGLWLLGFSPQPTLNQFDAKVGWSKKPNYTVERGTREFDVTFEMNSLGLRDDPLASPAKQPNTFRVLMLGDSFVMGYTVDREDLFVDQLERWWNAEDRRVDVINAGTEGYSTDQEVAWFLEQGADFQPDLVVIFPYENDIYWNGQAKYQRFPKPRFRADGSIETGTLTDPGSGNRPTWALQNFLAGLRRPSGEPPNHFEFDGKLLYGEWAPLLKDEPPFVADALERTRGALLALRDRCQELGAGLVMVPIPSESVVHADAREKFREQPTGLQGIDDELWDPDQPVDHFLRLAQELGIQSIDPRSALKARGADEKLYFDQEWHFNPAGNAAFATLLHDDLDGLGVFPEGHQARVASDLPAAPGPEGLPGWLALFGVLWVFLATSYCLTYRDEPAALAALKVGGLLTAIFCIFFGARWLLGLNPALSGVLGLLLVLVILAFVAIKLGRRLGTIAELMRAFTLRGHWYLMPMVVVLLTIGSLLVVAASSPLVAPFIYTLF